MIKRIKERIKMVELPVGLVAQVEELLTKQEKVLVSWVTKIELLNPLMIFKQGKGVYSTKRFFWQNPSKKVTLVGLGSTNQFCSNKGITSYQGVHEFNQQLKKQTATNQKRRATGALLFGGFDFDPERGESKEWQDFQSAFFYLPTYLVTVLSEETYLTINFYVDSQTDLHQKANEFFGKWEELLEEQIVPKAAKAVVTNKTELATTEWIQAVDETVELIKQSTTLQKVVLSRQLLVEHDSVVDVEDVLERLMMTQQNSYFFVLENKEKAFIGATPEQLLAAENQHYYSACVAGSAPRGKTKAEDQVIGEALLKDHKNTHEHHLVVEMISETLRTLTMDLNVSGNPTLLKNRDIQHLFVTVEGKRQATVPFLMAVKAMHPTPALGGLPRNEALAVIREKEPYHRGFYGAPIGWLNQDDEGEFAVAIRSALLMEKQSILFAGCGLVAGSKSAEELIETRIKFQPMLRALGGLDHE